MITIFEVCTGCWWWSIEHVGCLLAEGYECSEQEAKIKSQNWLA